MSHLTPGSGPDDAKLDLPVAVPSLPARRALAYLGPASVGAVVVLVSFRFWTWPTDGIWRRGIELWWVQAMAQVHMQAGPIGSTEHLGWPLGFSAWSHPQLGLGFGVLSWILGLLGVGSAMAGLFALGAAAFCDSLAMTYFLRSVFGSRMGGAVAAMSLAVAISPFVTQKLSNVNVAAFSVVPLLLGLAVRADGLRGARRSGFLLVLLVALLSPAWWLIAGLMVLLVGLVACALGARWTGARSLLVAAVAGLLAACGQFLLQAAFRDPAALATRGPWDSNSYGGYLTDLLIGSPWLDSLTRLDDAIVAGSASEVNRVGLVLVLASLVAVLAVMGGFPWNAARLDPRYVLRVLTTVVLLFFLAGGFGNLQAATAVLMGGESPARVWGRLLLVLGILGCVWLLAVIEWVATRSEKLRTWTRAPIVMVFVILAAFDNFSAANSDPVPVTFRGQEIQVDGLYRPEPVLPDQLPQAGAVHFLQASLAPCPVAQLPQDDFPTPRWLAEGNQSAYGALFYAGFVPYLIAPEFYWSYTSWYPGAKNGLQDVPLRLDDRSLDRLAARGFCGVLFDRFLGEVASAANVPLEGLGLSVTRAPDYSDERFSVFLLNTNETGESTDLGPSVPTGPIAGDAYVSSGGTAEFGESGPAFYWVTEETATIAAVREGEVSMTLTPPPCAETAEVSISVDGRTESLVVRGGGTPWQGALPVPGETIRMLAESPSCEISTGAASRDDRTFFYGIQGLSLT